MLKVRPRVRPTVLQEDELEYAETHLPVVVVSSIGMIAIRAAVGFFIFTIAFTLRRDSEPAYVYGFAAACYAVGAFVGHSVASMLRGRLREEQLIAVAIAAPAAFTAVGMLGVSVPLLMVIAALVGFSTTLGRNAFDALVQRVAPDALLGRAGARYETEFQLAWVFGGVLATPISLPVEVSMTVLTLIYVPGLLLFLRASREARLAGGDPARSARARGAAPRARPPGAGGRLVAAGDHRRGVGRRPRRQRLGRRPTAPIGRRSTTIRRRATDPDEIVAEADAVTAVDIAGRWVNPTTSP